MTRSPAASTVALPSWCEHDSADVKTLLVACHLHNDYGVDHHALAVPVLGPLPIDVAHEGLNAIAEQLAEASAVEQCTSRSAFTALTDMTCSGPLSEAVAWHAGVIRGDAAMAAALLVERANSARQEAS